MFRRRSTAPKRRGLQHLTVLGQRSWFWRTAIFKPKTATLEHSKNLYSSLEGIEGSRGAGRRLQGDAIRIDPHSRATGVA